MSPLPEDYILNGFFEQGVGRGACSVRSTHRPGIAVPLGTVHSFLCLKTGFIPKKRSLGRPPHRPCIVAPPGKGLSFFFLKTGFLPKKPSLLQKQKILPPPPPL